MATFKDLQDRINLDYLNRFNVISETKRAILNAIKTYEPRRYWFNMAQTASNTTASSAFYGVPSDFLALDRLELTYSGCQIPLEQAPLGKVRAMNTVPINGVPTHFTYYGDRFELAIVPDVAYLVSTYYIRTLAPLSADSDSNAWCNEASNLIVHHACVDLLCSVLQVNDERMIRRHATMLEMAQRELDLRNDQRLMSRLRATRF